MLVILCLLLCLLLWFGGVTINVNLTLIVEPAQTSNLVNVTTKQSGQKCLTP
jgi:hypothetical protein